MPAGYIGPRRTLRHIWRRGREIVRDEGWQRVVSLALADLGFHRFLLLERKLDEPIPAVAPRLRVTFTMLQPAEIDEYLRFHGRIPRALLEQRFARGDDCFLARHEGRIVCVSWISRDTHFFRSVGCRYPLGASEAYLYDSFVDPAFRGRAIAPALGAEVLERQRRAGVTRVVMAVVPANVANRRARGKTGFRAYGRLYYFRVGSMSWHWHRPVRGRRDATPSRSRFRGRLEREP